VIEALAAGVPVVQPRHAAFPELVEATGGGLLCEGTPGSLAEGIEQLMLNPQLARMLGERGRRIVHEHYSVERMADQLAGYLAEVAGSPAGASAVAKSELSKT
jgi:glycosyltransferase involved in cell wall biosynthesis